MGPKDDATEIVKKLLLAKKLKVRPQRDSIPTTCVTRVFSVVTTDGPDRHSPMGPKDDVIAKKFKVRPQKDSNLRSRRNRVSYPAP